MKNVFFLQIHTIKLKYKNGTKLFKSLANNKQINLYKWNDADERVKLFTACLKCRHKIFEIVVSKQSTWS